MAVPIQAQKDLRLIERRFVVQSYPDRGVTFSAGEGVDLLDSQGERYLDLMTNYGVDIFGHRHPRIIGPLVEQLSRLTSTHGSFGSASRGLAARALVERCGGGLSQVFFTNSGAEAVEAALKFAVLATGKKRFVACAGGFHGKTLGALSATHGEKYRAPFEPLLWDFVHVEFGNLDELAGALGPDTAAFIVEPVQGEAGVRLAPNGYLKNVWEFCRGKSILLILDEIQGGMGRTGSLLASWKDIDAYDLVCLGKGLAGGIPAGAVLVSPSVAAKIPKSVHSSTFGGNPLSSTGIVASLDVLDEELLAQVREVGAYFLEGLRALRSELITEARGSGLMLGLQVKNRRDDVLRGLQQKKILAIPAGQNVVRFLPPYILEKCHVDRALEALDSVLSSLCAASS